MTIQNNRLACRIAIGLALCLLSVLPAHAFRADEDQTGYLAKAPAVSRQGEPTVLQKQLFKEAEKAGLTIRRVSARSTPHSIRGTDLGNRSFSGVPGKQALRMTGNVRQDAVGVLDNLSGLMGIGKAADEFAFKSEQSDNLGFKHIRLNQLHRGLRVVGGEMIVHFDRNNKAYEANGQYIPGITIGTTAQLTATGVEKTAREGLVPLGFTKNVLLQQKPLLVVFAMDTSPTLAYELTLTAEKPYPAIWRIWIDAKTGETILRYNDIKTIAPPTANGVHTNITGTILSGEGGGIKTVTGWRENMIRFNFYYLYNKTNYWYVFNIARSGYPDAWTYAFRENANWGTSDPTEMSAARNFNTVQSYFRNVHGRNSFDNNNAYACANVHEDMVNAYWNGMSFHFGDGDGATANSLAVLDVCGHEFTHAVAQYTANFTYDGESGALDESFADIIGTCIEFSAQPDGRSAYPGKTAGTADWLCGEDCWLSSTALRDLRNPANTATVGAGNEQPTRYKGTYWDFGGEVHQNDGVQNFFFYLLSEGGSGVNDGISYSVNGIGIMNAARVAYRALTCYCHADTDYLSVRDAWCSAAADLNSGWVESVTSAWNAVGYGTTPPLPFINTIPSPYSDCSIIFVPEGGSAAFRVKLNEQPTEMISMIITTLSGKDDDPDITLQGGNPLILTFDGANWNTYQNVILTAAEDADDDCGGTQILCRAVIDRGGGCYEDVAQVNLCAMEVDDEEVLWHAIIIGYVKTASGEPVSGVSVVCNPPAEQNNCVTDADGIYGYDIAIPWPGTITPESDHYTFSPTSRTYSLTKGVLLVNQDFICSPPAIVASSSSINVPEGGTTTFGIKLSLRPLSNIIVNLSCAGDSDLSIVGSTNRTFTSANWDTYQTVTVAAAQDADTANGAAIIRCSATDWTGKDVNAVEVDNDIAISGYVKTSAGAAVSNVTINFSNNGGSVTNDAAGCYTQIVSKGWSGTATPSNISYIFNPVSRSYNNVQSNYPAQDYTASIAQVKITGYVNTSAGVGVDRVTLTFNNGGGTAATDISGFYAKYLTSGWSGVVTPSKTGYTFNPASRNYSNVRTNQVNQNYTAMVPVVTGAIVVSTGAITVPEGKTATFQVKLNTKPTANITVNVGRNSGDSDISVSGGASLTFTPANWSTYQTVTLSAAEDADAINGAAIIRCLAAGWIGKDVNAVEADNDVAISGYVKTSSGAAVAGVTINFSNNGGSAGTDAGGYYIRVVSKGWTGTATPSKSGYTFSPVSRSYSNVQSSYTVQDYTATAAAVTGAVVVSTGAITVPEGKTATFQVKLNTKPTANLTVNVSRVSGDSDISVSGGASLTFTPANWDTYQTVTLSAAEDADAINGAAIIRCSAAGWIGKDVNAVELDNDIFYTISGYIKNQYGKVAAGAVMDFYGSQGDILTAKTDAKGYYAGLLYKGWSGEAWPSCAGVPAFSPAFRSYSNLTANKTNQNYAGCSGPLPDPMPKLAPSAVDTFGRDLDGDGLMDPAVYCEANGIWDSLLSASEYEHKTISMGGSGYKAALADFDGDHRADLALYCASDGLFAVALSGDNYQTYWMQIGGAGYVLVPGDYDGDGKADPAVYQSASGGWRAKLSSANYADVAFDFGGKDYRAVPGDYDGDGKVDPAICNEQTAIWAVKYSAANYAEASGIFGHSGGKAVPADYDGDGKTDPAMYYPSTSTISGQAGSFDDAHHKSGRVGTWEVWHSGNGYALTEYSRLLGGDGFVPIPGDYDGDGLTDPAVYNPETGQWRVLLSGQGYTQRVEYLGKPVSLPVGMPP